jgi:hypothetical protein
MSGDITVTLPSTFPKRRLMHLLCCALEGGSNYWYKIAKFIHPNGPVEAIAYPAGEQTEVFRHLDYPLSDAGGALMITDMFGDHGLIRLDLPRLLEGLRLMAEKQPRHFGNWRDENEDGDTGDVFLQLCVFGKVVYG